MNNGGWVGSRPYAYRTEGARKHKRLVIDDPGKARIVQRIFREFVEEGRSMSDIAARLNAEGVISPRGRVKGWRFDSVKTILENPAYTGDFAAGRWSGGKYHHIAGGRVEKGGGKGRKAKAQWVIRQGHHEAIVERGLYEHAQAILERGKTGRSPYRPEENPCVLSCLLRCGKCRCVLGGMKGGKGAAIRYYECHNFKRNGPEACEGTTVRESEVLRLVAEELEAWLGLDADALGEASYYGALKEGDLPEALEKVRALILPPRRSASDRKRLERQAEQLRAQVEKARANLVLLEPANIPAAQDRIRQLDRERQEAEEELRQGTPPADKDVNALALEVLHGLYSLAYCCRAMAMPAYVDGKGNRGVDNGDGTVTFGSLESAAPQAVKRLLSRVSHIVCHTERRGKGPRTRHVFTKGELVFRVGPMTRNLNPHLTG